MNSPRDIVVVGAAFSEMQRRSEKTVGQLSVDAAASAIAQAGLKTGDIDGLANFPSPSRPGAGALDGVDVVSPVYMAQALRLDSVRWHTSLTRGSYTGSIAEAANALRANACDYALVWRAMHNPPGKYGRVSPGPVGGDDAFTAPYGFTNEVVRASMIYARYMAKYGTDRSDMAKFVVPNRAKAAKNPDAVFYGQPITTEDYLNARKIVEPMSLLDCDMAIDGCAAIVLTRRELSPVEAPVVLRTGLNLGLPRSRRNFYVLEDFQEAAAYVAKRTMEESGMSADDFTHLEFYDGFVYFPWLWMEAFGMAKPGDAREYMTEEICGINGSRPLNTGGGSLGVGRIHGGAHVLEAIRQIQGVCGDRQIPEPRVTIVTSGSPLTGCGSLVFTPSDA